MSKPKKNIRERIDVSQISAEDWKKEKKRLKYRQRYKRTLRSTVGTLLVAAAVAVIVATMWLPVLRVYGTSMSPTLEEGDIVGSIKTSSFETGDVVAFYYNNKLLLKRVIAGPGDWVDINDEGTVYVNGAELDEPYLKEKALGETDIEYPYQVPEDRWFVMGDHRSTSLDSRMKSIGSVAEEQIVGKLTARLWPLSSLSAL